MNSEKTHGGKGHAKSLKLHWLDFHSPGGTSLSSESPDDPFRKDVFFESLFQQKKIK